MLTTFILKRISEARFKTIEDGTIFGEIPGLRGVWASAKTLKACRQELRSALEDWLLVKLRDGDSIPGLENSANLKQRADQYLRAK